MAEELTGRALDFAVGRRLYGYHVYHYDKDVQGYYTLLDGDEEPLYLSLEEVRLILPLIETALIEAERRG